MKPNWARLADSPRIHEARLARRVGRYPYFSRVESASLPVLRVEGRDLLNFGSNNYLGLATDPRVVDAAASALRAFGSGVSGSRLLNGTLALHETLEARLAAFFDKEAALVFPTGYSANLGLLSGVLRPGDLVAADREIHASLVDGLLLSRATLRRFPHNDPAALAAILQTAPPGQPTAIIVEGVYSMRGDAAPIADFVALAELHGALLIVDEAHGVGAVGPRGRGGAERAGALAGVDVVTVTFSKSLASCGGAVVGSAEVIEALRTHSRPFQFTASNTPGSLAAALCALQILEAEPEMVEEVQLRARQLGAALASVGISAQLSDSPILTVPAGSDFETLQAWRMLRNRGVFCNPVLTPAVRPGQGLLRLSVMRTHTSAQIDEAAEAFSALAPWLGRIEPKNLSLETPTTRSMDRRGRPEAAKA